MLPNKSPILDFEFNSLSKVNTPDKKVDSITEKVILILAGLLLFNLYLISQLFKEAPVEDNDFIGMEIPVSVIEDYDE